MIIDAAPDGFAVLRPINLHNAFSVMAERALGEARVLVVADASGQVQLEMKSSLAAVRPAVILPLDAAYDLRVDVASRFARRLAGARVQLLPTALRLTTLQRRRLIELLHAFDIHGAGGGPRDVAAEVLGSDHANLPSIEWKDSHARRKANRLISEAVALVDRGYLKLLRGG